MPPVGRWKASKLCHRYKMSVDIDAHIAAHSFCKPESLMKSLSALSSASIVALGLWIMAPLPVLSQIGPPADGSVLPFPPKPSTIARRALPCRNPNSYRFPAESHLPKNAPNILIILLDDVGFGLPDTFGGPVHTPTLSRLAGEGISYNTFHTTSICSPTRAALLTGRNHQRVGSGTIAERAVNWDGYTGVIPRTSATLAKVLGNYGYNTAAFGKWHNTPATQTTAMGPFTLWPTGEGIGFDYFYGFLAGETSQWEPRLTENLNPVEPPHDEKYHLSEDLADKAIGWLRKHEAYTPDKPFLMYWATGASHGPHHIFKEWADKYKGKFDTGWDELRERTFKRQKELGWIPASAQLTPRDKTMASWDSIPASERAFQTRLMEIFAGFTEHADVQAGKVIDELDRLGIRDNTLVFYIFGDNGSSAEGQHGTISELLAQNGIPNTIEQQLAALDKLGGIDVLGGPKTDNMYHAGWAWAGGTPFKGTKLLGSYFGGTRNPMVIDWPGHIKHDKTPRAPVPPRQRHRADHLRHRRHQAAEGRRRFQAGPDGRRQPGLHVRECDGARPESHAVFRQQRQPRHLSRWLVCLRGRTVRAVGSGRLDAGDQGLGRQQGRLGALRPAERLCAGQ